MTETIVSLQSMITYGNDQSNSIVLHCIKNLEKVGNGRAKASMISLLR